MDSSFIKLENEIKADESIRDRDIMYELSKNLCKEARTLGLMRIGFCLDTMMKSVWFDRDKPDYVRYSGMYPIMRTE